MRTYAIHERFYTFQGEGVHMGCPAFFVRTFGCPIHCPFCDSAGTWHPDFVPANVSKMTTEDIVREALLSQTNIVVITGGEPAVLDLSELVIALQVEGLKVHLETSGAFRLKGLFDWVTVSPKKWEPPIAENVMLADEFKIIVEAPSDIELYLRMLKDLGLPELTKIPIWLHPEWSHRHDPEVLKAIVDFVKLNSGNHRAGYQLHKLYQADLSDGRSRPSVPLGGNPARGY